MGYHPPSFNDVRFCRLQWQPQLHTELGGISLQPPILLPCTPILCTPLLDAANGIAGRAVSRSCGTDQGF